MTSRTACAHRPQCAQAVRDVRRERQAGEQRRCDCERDQSAGDEQHRERDEGARTEPTE
jgi:hypothetical protein